MAPMPVLILAGGYATRLRPITERIPKSLVDIDGRPFIRHQLESLKKQGIRQVVMAVGHLGEIIRDYIGDGRSLELNVEYSFDGPSLLGTGGAARKALPLLAQEFFVLYGDSYLTCDYGSVLAAFREKRLPALMTVYCNAGRFDASNVEFDGSRILRYDKKDRSPSMQYIDYGLGVFHRSAFDSFDNEAAFDLADVYQSLLREGKLAAHEVHERFYEIGSPQGLQETIDFLRGRSAVEFRPHVQ